MIKKISAAVIVVVGLITIWMSVKIVDLEFDYDFDKFFPSNNSQTDFYQNHRQVFETDNDFALIAVSNGGNSVYDSSFLHKVKSFSDELSEYYLIKNIQSVISAREQLKAPFSNQIFEKKYLRIDQPEYYSIDSARITERPEIMNAFIDEEAKHLTLFIQHKQYLSKEGCDSLVTHINSVIADYDFKDVYRAGRSFGQVYYVDIMKTELTFFILISMVLVVFFLLLAFKSAWGIWLPLTVVTITLVWITGFMGAVDQPVNLIMTVLPTIMFVVAMSDVIHLVSKYLDEIRQGSEKLTALKTAYKEIGWATFLTSLTTAVGFLSLLMVGVEPIQVFGKYTAIGVVIAFVLAYTLLPALLYFSPIPKIANKPLYDVYWNKVLHKGFRIVLRKRKVIILISLIVISISCVGFFQLKSNNYLLDDLKKDDPVKQEFMFFQEHFAGVRPFELAIQVKDSSKSVFDADIIRQINKVDQYLLSHYGLEQVNSLPSIIKVLNRGNHMGDSEYYKLPESDKELNKIINQLKSFGYKSGKLKNMIDSTGTYTRSFSTIGDLGNIEISSRNEAFKEAMDTLVNSKEVDLTITGTAHLLDVNMKYLSTSLMQGLLLALAIVALIMGFLFKSLRIVLIAIIPNVLPLIMIAAVMGFFDIPLKMTTSIIYTIAFGIAVDDTIHFMTKYKLELNKGRSPLYALKRTYISTGKAIIVTSLIIAGGFLLLIFSSFLGTFYIGLLISLTLLFAVISDLFVLPLLLIYFYRPKNKVNQPKNN